MPKVRKLKFHEQKLLKKVDFLNWKSDGIKPEYREYILKMINKYKLRDQKEFFK
jgi:U3 small nucleolar ribonucleoprotein protein IMP3